jgi:hypothetical protein
MTAAAQPNDSGRAATLTCIKVHPVLIEFGELANIPASTQNHTSAMNAGERDKEHITHR